MKVSATHYRRMKNAYDLQVAKFIAAAARDGRKVTYGDLEAMFGKIARSWGDTLGGIAIRCHEAGLPKLSVLVVRSDTGLPSVDAVLYEDLGLTSPQLIEGRAAAVL
ncbi:MAG TPA: hypothetical protein VG757_03230 [Devosia sp.]|nr:hypothetical protein [Devosia sp.]